MPRSIVTISRATWPDPRADERIEHVNARFARTPGYLGTWLYDGPSAGYASWLQDAVTYHRANGVIEISRVDSPPEDPTDFRDLPRYLGVVDWVFEHASDDLALADRLQTFRRLTPHRLLPGRLRLQPKPIDAAAPLHLRVHAVAPENVFTTNRVPQRVPETGMYDMGPELAVWLRRTYKIPARSANARS